MSKLFDLAVELGLEQPKHELTLDEIKTGIRRYYEEKGKSPGQLSGDASMYIQGARSWASINERLIILGTSLRKLATKMGLVEHYHKPCTLDEAREGVRKYCTDHGRAPGVKSGNAAAYVPYPMSWQGVDRKLHTLGTSLRQLTADMQYRPLPGEFTLEDVEKGVLSFHEKYGVAPTKTPTPSADYVAGSRTWRDVDERARHQWDITLHQLTVKMGLAKPHRHSYTLEDIRAGILRFHTEFGRSPTLVDREASAYVPGADSWVLVNDRLRHTWKTSLRRIAVEIGSLPSREYTLEDVRAGILRYYQECHTAPYALSGSASIYVPNAKSWGSVDARLRGNCGLSLSELKKQMVTEGFLPPEAILHSRRHRK